MDVKHYSFILIFNFLKIRKNLCQILFWTTINFPSLLLFKIVLDYIFLINYVFMIKARWSDVNNRWKNILLVYNRDFAKILLNV